MERTRKVFVLIIGGVLILLLVWWITENWPDGEEDPTPTANPSSEPTPLPPGTQTPPPGSVIIAFWTNDTKADWVNAVTEVSNQEQHQTAPGKDVWLRLSS